MRSELIRILNNLTRRRKNREAFRRFVSALSAIVVFVTTYALILPAITMTVAPGCGMEEHTHSDSCYEITVNEETGEETKELTCGKEEHTHTEACYEAAAQQIEEKNRERRAAEEAEQAETLVFEETTESAPVETEVTEGGEETNEGETTEDNNEQTTEGQTVENTNTDGQGAGDQTTEGNDEQNTDGQQSEEHNPIENHETAEELQHELDVVKEEMNNEELTDEEKAALEEEVKTIEDKIEDDVELTDEEKAALEEEAKKLEEELAAELAAKEAEEKAAAAQEEFSGMIAQLNEELAAMMENEELTIEEIEAFEAKIASLQEELSAEDTDLTEEAAAELNDAAAELSEKAAELKAATEERLAALEEEKYAAKIEIEQVEDIEAVIYTGSSYEAEADDSTTITVSGKLPVAYYLDRETDEEKNELAVEVRAYATDASRIRVNDEARAILSYDITIFYKDEFRTEETGETFQPEGSLQVSFESPSLAKSDDDMSTVYSVYHVPEDNEPVLVAEESAAAQEAKLRALVEEEVEANNELIDEINKAEKEAAEEATVNEVLVAIAEEATTEEELLEKVAAAIDEQAAAVTTNISASMPDVPEQPLVDEVEITDISEVASGVAEMVSANMIASLNAEEAEETSEAAQVEVTVSEEVGHLQLEKEESTGKITFEAKHFSEYALLATPLDASHNISDKIRVTGVSVQKNGTPISETNAAQAYDQHTLVIDMASSLEFLNNQIRANDYFDIVLPKEFKYGSGSFRALTFGPITARGDIYEEDGNKILHITVTSIGQAFANEASFSFLAQVPFNLDELEPNSTKTITASMKDGSSSSSTTISIGDFTKREVDGNGDPIAHALNSAVVKSVALLPQAATYYTNEYYGLQIGWEWRASSSSPDLRVGDYFTIQLPNNMNYYAGTNPSFNLLNTAGQKVADATLDTTAKTIKVTFTDYINGSDDYIYAAGSLTVDTSSSEIGRKTLVTQIAENHPTDEDRKTLTANFEQSNPPAAGTKYVIPDWAGTGKKYAYSYYEVSSFTIPGVRAISTQILVDSTDVPGALSYKPWKGDGSDNYFVTYCVEEDNSNLKSMSVYSGPSAVYDRLSLEAMAYTPSSSQAKYTTEHVAKLKRLLAYSYPYISVDAMQDKLGLDFTLDRDVATAAVQMAIWRTINVKEITSDSIIETTDRLTDESDITIFYPHAKDGSEQKKLQVYKVFNKLMNLGSATGDTGLSIAGIQDVKVTSVEQRADGTSQYTLKVTLARRLYSTEHAMFTITDGKGNTKTIAVTKADQADDFSFTIDIGNVAAGTDKLTIDGKITDDAGTVTGHFFYNGTYQNQIGGINCPTQYTLHAEITLSAKTEITVSKIWKNVTPAETDWVKVQLYGDYGDGYGETAIDLPVELKAPTWSYTYTGLPYYRKDSKIPVNYKVKEVAFCLNGKEYTVDSDGSTGSGIIVSNGLVRTTSGSFSNSAAGPSTTPSTDPNSQASAFGSVLTMNRTGLATGLAASLSRMRGTRVLDTTPVDVDREKTLTIFTKSTVDSSDDGKQIFIRRDMDNLVLTYTGSGISWQTQAQSMSGGTYDNVRKQLWVVHSSGDMYCLQNLFNPDVWLSVDSAEYWKAGSTANYRWFKGGAENAKVLRVSNPKNDGYDMYWKWMKPNGSAVFRDGLTYYLSGASAVTFGGFNEMLSPGPSGCGNLNYVYVGAGAAEYYNTVDMVIHQEATITNTLTQGKTEIVIKKVWETPDQTLPVSATVRLLQDGVFNPGFEYVLDRSNNWTVKVENLAYYKPGTMEPIKYTVEEVSFKYGNEVYINDANLSQKGFSVNVTGPVPKTNSGSGNNSQASAAGSVYMLNTTTLRSNRMASLGRLQATLLRDTLDGEVTSVGLAEKTSVPFNHGSGNYYQNQIRVIYGGRAFTYNADGSISLQDMVSNTGLTAGTWNDLRRQLWTVGTKRVDSYNYYTLQNVYDTNVYLTVRNGSISIGTASDHCGFLSYNGEMGYFDSNVFPPSGTLYDSGVTFEVATPQLTPGHADPATTEGPGGGQETQKTVNITNSDVTDVNGQKHIQLTVDDRWSILATSTSGSIVYAPADEVTADEYLAVSWGGVITARKATPPNEPVEVRAMLYGNDSVYDSVYVTIVNASPQTVPVTGIALNRTSLSMSEGGAVRSLTATVAPDNATDPTVTWTSSKPSVATVTVNTDDENGRTVTITSVGAGNATITATAGGLTATCQVEVLSASSTVPTDIVLTSEEITLYVGDTMAFDAEVMPATASDKTIIWGSTHSSIAKFEQGMIVARGVGTAHVYASTSNGITKYCQVNVLPRDSGDVEVSSIALTPTAMELTAGGATGTITANIAPNNATNKNITWTSSNLSVATVSADGVVTPLTRGTTTITASTANGKTAECIVTVKAAGSGEQGGDDPVVIGNVITQEFTVTNSINGTAEIQVRKVWSGFGSETDNAQVTVELLEKVGDKEVAVDYSYVNGVKTNRAVLTRSNGWTAKWTGLNQSKLRNYVVKEIGVTGANLKYFTSESWNADHSQVTITNTKDTPLTYKTHVHVVKVWEDNNRLNVPNITVTLLQNGDPYTGASPLVLNDSNQWSGWFRDLPAYDSNGRQYIYTVDETVPAGYDSVSPVKTEYSDIVEVLQNASSGSSTATYYGGSDVIDSMSVYDIPKSDGTTDKYEPRKFFVMTRSGSGWNKTPAFCLNHAAQYPEDVDRFSAASSYPQYMRTTINSYSDLAGHIGGTNAYADAYKQILKAVYYGAGNDAAGIGSNGLSDDEFFYITQRAIWDVTNLSANLEYNADYEVTKSTGLSHISQYYAGAKQTRLRDAYKALMQRVLDDDYNGPINSLTMHVYEHKSGTGYLNATYQTLFSIEAVRGITTRTATITNTSNLRYGKIKVVKFGDDTNAGIDGVLFSLYEAYTPAAGETNVPTIKVNGVDTTVKWLADYVTAEVSGEHGVILTDPKGDFPGLEDGKTYYLVETVAPAGYKKLAEPIEFVIMANANKTEWLVGGDVKEAIVFKPAVTDGEQLGTIRVKNEKLHFNFDLTKVEKDTVPGDEIKYLPGAKFLLIDAGEEDAEGGLYVGSSGGSRLPSGYVIDPRPGSDTCGKRAPYADNYNSYVIVTDNAGKFQVNNLLPNKPNRQYILVEIEAPEGYWKQSQVGGNGQEADYYSFKVELISSNGDNVLSMTQGANEGEGVEQSDRIAFVDGTVQIRVGNALAYYELPKTGGAGTNMFTLGGIIIMALAAALLMYRKINDMRKEVAN